MTDDIWQQPQREGASKTSSHLTSFHCLVIPVIILVTLTMSSASAQDLVQPGSERLGIDVGVFFPAFDSKVRLDANEFDLGDEIDFEDDLKLDKNLTVFRIDGYFRITKRNRVRAAHYRFRRDNTLRLETELEYGDTVFPIDISVDVLGKNTITEFSYMYSILQRERLELSAMVGFHIMSFLSRITSSDLTLGESGDITAPLPVFGAHFRYLITPEFQAEVAAQWFGIEVGDFGGSLTNLNASGKYFFHEYIGAGLGVNQFNMKIDLTSKDFHGKVRWKYTGLQLFATVRY